MVRTSIIRAAAFSPRPDTIAPLATAFVKLAASDPSFDEQKRTVWLPGDPMPEGNLRLEVALCKLNEVLVEVLSSLELAQCGEEKLRLEQAAALLVQNGTPIGPEVLLAAAKCDEKNPGGETPLLSAVVQCSDSIDCWELGCKCLGRLVEVIP